jgi:hypothetical protein
MLLSRHAAFKILGELARLHNKKIVRHISAPVLLARHYVHEEIDENRMESNLKLRQRPLGIRSGGCVR